MTDKQQARVPESTGSRLPTAVKCAKWSIILWTPINVCSGLTCGNTADLLGRCVRNARLEASSVNESDICFKHSCVAAFLSEGSESQIA